MNHIITLMKYVPSSKKWMESTTINTTRIRPEHGMIIQDGEAVHAIETGRSGHPIRDIGDSLMGMAGRSLEPRVRWLHSLSSWVFLWPWVCCLLSAFVKGRRDNDWHEEKMGIILGGD